MSASEAFCTLRIFPRIGSSAWNSLFRADLAVPSALSPSTINNSVRSLSSLRQSFNLAGKVEDSSAVFRRWVSRWWRAASRAREAFAIFSSTVRTAGFAPRGGLVNQFESSLLTTALTIFAAAGVPSISFVWPSNCGSAKRTVTTAVIPSCTSSLVMESSPAFRSRCALSCSFTVFTIARSKPVTCVPPLGVEMMFTYDCNCVS